MAMEMICAVLMLTFGVYAVISRSILRSAIGLALASAALASLFYLMGAELTAMFELSVCSGLVTVIFIAGVSLSHSPKMDLQTEYRDNERNRFLPALLIAVGAVMIVLALVVGGEPLAFALPDGKNVKDVLWHERQADVWGQIAAILCGGVAVAVLFREERRDQ